MLLLDVDDIDRVLAAGGFANGPAGGAPGGVEGDAPALLARRGQLVAGVVAALNLPDDPQGANGGGGGGGRGDAVFSRVLQLPKGRSLLARALAALLPASGIAPDAAGRCVAHPCVQCTLCCVAAGSCLCASHAAQRCWIPQHARSPPPCSLPYPHAVHCFPCRRRVPTACLKAVWALLRNAAALYGPAIAPPAPAAPAGAGAAKAPADDERRLMETTERLSSSAGELLKRLADAGDLCSCLQAFTAGAPQKRVTLGCGLRRCRRCLCALQDDPPRALPRLHFRWLRAGALLVATAAGCC